MRKRKRAKLKRTKEKTHTLRMTENRTTQGNFSTLKMFKERMRRTIIHTGKK